MRNYLINLFSSSRINLNINSKIKQRLNSIPSETSELERVFLYNFMRTFWDGKSKVVELGPFLGGTTRALIIGMLDNPRRLEYIKLKTIDSFKDYYSTEEIIGMYSSDKSNSKKVKALLESKKNMGY